MAKLGDMTITAQAHESFNHVIALTPLIKRLIELLEAHDPARVLTMRAPDTAAQEALIDEIMDFLHSYLPSPKAADITRSFLRERLNR